MTYLDASYRHDLRVDSTIQVVVHTYVHDAVYYSKHAYYNIIQRKLACDYISQENT